MTTRILTGITPTGTPHLGNYAGAIRPAILASRRSDVDPGLRPALQALAQRLLDL
ncbi:hypothetical protein, partial [Pseudomonas aeruginosa]|uniref:hypothetical protein n=1 Tax=Pseudomonas aeruginosa TaxID=287 RepID=UPI00396AA3F3